MFAELARLRRRDRFQRRSQDVGGGRGAHSCPSPAFATDCMTPRYGLNLGSWQVRDLQQIMSSPTRRLQIDIAEYEKLQYHEEVDQGNGIMQ